MIDFSNLEEMCDERTKILLFCNPHNPVGRVWSRDELTQLASFCLERGIVLVSNEVHADIVFHDHQFHSMASLSEEFVGNTVVLMSAAKSFSLSDLGNFYTIIKNHLLREQFITSKEAAGFNNYLGNIVGIKATEVALSKGF